MAANPDKHEAFAPVSNFLMGFALAAFAVAVGTVIGAAFIYFLGDNSRLSMREAIMMGAREGWYVSLGAVGMFVLALLFRGRGKTALFFQLIGGAVVWIPCALAFGWKV